MIKGDEKYGLARDLKEALLGRQPKVHFLSLYFIFFLFSVICMSPFSLHTFDVCIEGYIKSKHGGGIVCMNS